MMLQAANCRPPGVLEVSGPSDYGLLVSRLRGGKALHSVARTPLSSIRVLPDASVHRRTRLVSGSTGCFAAACHCRCPVFLKKAPFLCCAPFVARLMIADVFRCCKY